HLLRRERRDPAELRQVLDGLLAVERRDLAGVAADLDDDVLLHPELLLGRRQQRGLDPGEDDLLVDALLAMQGVHDPQDLAALHATDHRASDARPCARAVEQDSMELSINKAGRPPEGNGQQGSATTARERHCRLARFSVKRSAWTREARGALRPS